MIEFALSISFLVFMFMGAIELSRYVLVTQRVEKTINTITDVLAQSGPISVSGQTVSDSLNAAQKIMSPYSFASNGLVILSSVSTPVNSASPATVNWQVCGGGTLNKSSMIGTVGSQAKNLPNGFTLIADEQVVVGEIYYYYTPILLQNIVPATTIYRAVIFSPRLGALTVTSSTCP